MNVADSEVVAAILQERQYKMVQSAEEADVVFLNNCSVRDNAEQRILGRLKLVAKTAPGRRVRFTTSHPKDMLDKVLHKMAGFPNLCKHIHLPVQPVSSRILKLMNRKYDRHWYLDHIVAIRSTLPDCGMSTEITKTV